MRWGKWADCMGIICLRSDDLLLLPFLPVFSVPFLIPWVHQGWEKLGETGKKRVSTGSVFFTNV